MLLKKLAPCTSSVFIKAKYATVASPRDPWSRSTNPNRPPTPYQILSLDPSSPYSKENFTELVKLYHPDRREHPASHICSHLSHKVRLERYHLIVAAHTLLSDSTKRRLYDMYGIGWVDAALIGSRRHPAARTSTTGKKCGPFTAHSNATWEDWENWRWEQREWQKHGKRAEPKFVANGTFASGILMVTLLAALLQQSHIDSVTNSRRTMLTERSWEAENFIRKKKEEARARTKTGRIEEFMKQRDPTLFNHPGLANAVMNPDLCADVGLRRSDTEIHLKKIE
jgi:curved DNA-binding protein CbpA